MPNDMKDTIELVNATASRLGEFLSGLDEQQWSANSACEGWTVADAAAHVTASASTWATNIARAMAGDSGPPEGQSFMTPGERGSSGLAQNAITYREESGSKLLDNFTSGYADLKEQMAKLREENWEKPCFHRRGPLPIGDYVALRVQELTVHGWDIRWGLDPDAEIWPEPLALMVGRVPRWLSNAFRPGLDLPTPVRYRFDVDGPVAVKEDLVVTGDAFQAEANASGDADAVFLCDTGNYILLLYGRLDVDQATVEGRLRVQGSLEQAVNFTAWFKGF